VTEYLALEDLLDLCGDMDVVVRDVGLLDSAVARPRSTVFGEDAYKSLEVKAAALMQSLAKNPPLVDGNRRLAWAATMLFLDINGHTSSLTQAPAVDLTIQVASSNVEVGWIAAELVVVAR
jgi:death-on-curing protein